MQEVWRVLLEGGHRVQRVLGVGVDGEGAARDDHGREGFVGFLKVLVIIHGDGDEVRLQVVAVLDEDAGGDERGEGFGGEVAGFFALHGLQLGAEGVVGGEFGADVGVDAVGFLWRGCR